MNENDNLSFCLFLIEIQASKVGQKWSKKSKDFKLFKFALTSDKAIYLLLKPSCNPYLTRYRAAKLAKMVNEVSGGNGIHNCCPSNNMSI